MDRKKIDVNKIIFFIIAYLVPWVFVPWIKQGTMSLVFGEYIMTLPTSGVILGEWYIIKERKGFFSKDFYSRELLFFYLYIFLYYRSRASRVYDYMGARFNYYF